MTLDIDGWSPPTGDIVELVAAGDSWDAVRVPTSIGLPLIDRLGHDTGAVIQDTGGGGLYWLIRPKTADVWTLPQPFVHVLGAACHVWVPPVDRTEEHHRMRWIVPLTRTCYLTDPERLHDALRAEIDTVTGPRPVLLPCDPCITDSVLDRPHTGCEGVSSMGITGTDTAEVPAAPCPCNHLNINPAGR